VRRVQLYHEPAEASISQMVDTLMQSVRPQTRIVAVTWVHSSTGVKLPIRESQKDFQRSTPGEIKSTARFYASMVFMVLGLRT